LLPRAQVDRLVALVDRLEQVADVRELTTALRR
jgi:nitrogen-specific signal transduction histidine kinase